MSQTDLQGSLVMKTVKAVHRKSKRDHICDDCGMKCIGGWVEDLESGMLGHVKKIRCFQCTGMEP